jgi:phage shock protein PspC (stress-responsive transcriptional regulator)
MKKVININFQGRVIPIEETAYDILQQYIDSLRAYFANEEGRDEIINDIEGRIAELFSERLKKGATCITDEDVNAVIASMGRPSDFEQADADAAAAAAGGPKFQQSEQQQQAYTYPRGRGRLYRNADDKILGGVCSGLATYLGIDPVVMRILFVVFIGALFWVYIVLWIIVPSKSIQSDITKRLYRSTEDRVIGGVCGGMSAYFNVSPWVPRLIFALPLILAIVSGPFNYWWGDFDIWWGPKMVTGSLSFTLFVTYIILWISVPVAVTAAEKLEMRGEKVDVNSIRDTVKGDIESFKSRAQNFGNEVKDTAQRLGQQAKAYGQSAAKTYSTEAAPAVRSAGSNFGHVIGILFKAFFLFIAGIIALSLFGVLMGLLFGGFVVFPFKDFVLEGFWQNALAWVTLVFFLGIPIIALITWLIRRIAGIRSRNHYLGYVFGSLWTIGLISAIVLTGMYFRNFKYPGDKQDSITIVQPANDKLYVDVASARTNIQYYGGDWFGFELDEDWPIYGENQDTLMLNTVGVRIVKSQDSLFHVHRVNISQGRSVNVARELAGKIQYDIVQRDSVLVLPRGYGISRDDKFRNQRIVVVIEVPVGKKIELDQSVTRFSWFTVNFNRKRGWNVQWDDDNWHNSYGWWADTEYIMTPTGLERTSKDNANNDDQPEDDGTDSFNVNIENNGVKVKVQGKVEEKKDRRYRYQPSSSGNSGATDNKKDSTKAEDNSNSPGDDETPHTELSISPIYILGRYAG